ncbi:glycoside hydrolase family 57 [Desulfonatronum sp. SC1]|uniref:glycoside hydrolase family 57 n=1 Tax=Desulfonatronum sp. SC1 TaxID=2109626 RepID=UPI000D30E256|nr:glycoside hydrolase family 57 [Desulfonatronum sp. SC1]PTN34153.1 glycoside hydrolase family 57 [Desulfonatronum sp. SC1]
MHLYSFFHLNITYSSIEEQKRLNVIQRCYRPLLQLADKLRIPIGIEAPGYTLEVINSLDPQWIAELRRLCGQGLVEFIGSGYTQVIGPLVPAEVNAANLRVGNRVYEKLLGLKPRIALVNEQAYSAGLLRHYLDVGYKAIIMEWNNPARFHPQWDPEWRYLPQRAVGQYGEELALIWNKSISFQKFQRYAHGEMDLGEYMQYLESHLSDSERSFCLYGNDAEMFDFRPGRFHTEAALQTDGEWRRIEKLFWHLIENERFQFTRPSSVLELMENSHAGNRLRLETAEQPVPVKKQEKYNLTRWAVTGAHDLRINTDCWRIFEALNKKEEFSPRNPRKDTEKREEREQDWKELCYLWSSDFRTHITEKRLKNYLLRLEDFKEKVLKTDDFSPTEHSGKHGNESGSRMLPASGPPTPVSGRQASGFGHQHSASMPFRVFRGPNLLEIESHHSKLQLNCRKGLAIHNLWFKELSSLPLVGTLPHGYFDDISMGADFFSGHLVLEMPGKPKVTDLTVVEPVVDESVPGRVSVHGTINTPLGTINKVIVVGTSEQGGPIIRISYALSWQKMPIGSLRLGAVTLNPEAFDPETLFYATHNGGHDLEKFSLHGCEVNHGAPASFLVSASHGLGVTKGQVFLGDKDKQIRIHIDNAQCAAIGLLTHRKVKPDFFCRHAFSVMEMDETSDKWRNEAHSSLGISNFCFIIT